VADSTQPAGPVPPGPRGPLASPGFWLHHAALRWRQAMDDELRPLGLTHTQFNLLGAVSWLSRQHGPPTQQEAAELSGSDRMMASKVLAALEDSGLVIRTPDPHDARSKRITLTTRGKAVIHRAVQIAADVDAALFGAGPDRDRLTDELRQITAARHRHQQPADRKGPPAPTSTP
jgi:DNA-binding MarR family transcriptional regulator